MHRERLLIVDDDDDLRLALADVLCDDGWVVRVAATLEQARAVVAAWDPDAVLLDYCLPDGDCDEFLEELRARDREPYVLLVSGSHKAPKLARETGTPLVSKPIDADLVKRTLRAA